MEYVESFYKISFIKLIQRAQQGKLPQWVNVFACKHENLNWILHVPKGSKRYKPLELSLATIVWQGKYLPGLK